MLIVNFWCKSNFSNLTFLSSISFCSTSTILLILSIKSSARRKSSPQFSYQHIVIMIFTYEKRLITFKKWLHINFIFENLIVVEFCHELNIKNFITCSECDLKLNNWKFKRNSMKAHMRQSSNCVLIQKLNITFKKTSIVKDSTSTKFVSINCIASSPQMLYLIIENLY